MIRTTSPLVWVENGYPTSDGKPMAETELHRDLTIELIETLKIWFANEQNICVSGNMLVFYEKGDKRRHVAPDVFVTRGVDKHERGNYLMWEEGHGLDVVIELTSKTTVKEDIKKRDLYLNKLGVKEYYLFDPKEEYLKPSFQAFRRVGAEFRPIKLVDGRVPSKVLKLHLERVGRQLRLWDPIGKKRVPTRGELASAEAARADQASARADEAEAEVARLRLLLEHRHRNARGNGK